MHLIPAGFPSGIPGMGEDIEIAMQQAPQPGLQSMLIFFGSAIYKISSEQWIQPLEGKSKKTAGEGSVHLQNNPTPAVY